MENKLRILAAVFICMSLGSSSRAQVQEPATKPIAKETEGLILKRLEKPAAGWTRLKNDFYQVDHPSCYLVDGIASGDLPVTKSSTVSFTHTERCSKEYAKLPEFETTASVTFKELTAIFAVDQVHGSYLTVNGRKAKLIVNSEDPKRTDGLAGVTFIWRVYVDCGKQQIIEIGYLQKGHSLDGRAENGDFAIQNEFKSLVSSFVCGPELLK